MSWFNSTFISIGIYGSAAVATQIATYHLIQFIKSKIFKKEKLAEREISMRHQMKIHLNGVNLFWVIITLAITFAGYRFGYITMTLLLFSLATNILTYLSCKFLPQTSELTRIESSSEFQEFNFRSTKLDFHSSSWTFLRVFMALLYDGRRLAAFHPDHRQAVLRKPRHFGGYDLLSMERSVFELFCESLQVQSKRKMFLQLQLSDPIDDVHQAPSCSLLNSAHGFHDFNDSFVHPSRLPIQ
jgi:hypothetical protein